MPDFKEPKEKLALERYPNQSNGENISHREAFIEGYDAGVEADKAWAHKRWEYSGAAYAYERALRQRCQSIADQTLKKEEQLREKDTCNCEQALVLHQGLKVIRDMPAPQPVDDDLARRLAAVVLGTMADLRSKRQAVGQTHLARLRKNLAEIGLTEEALKRLIDEGNEHPPGKPGA